MNKISTLYIFVFLYSFSYSQNKDDYFQKIIDTTKNKELKLASLDSLIRNQKNIKDLSAFADRTELYVDLAIELEQYEKAIKFATRGFYHINESLGQRERALKLIEKVEKHKEQTTSSFLLGNIYLKKGGAYFSLNEYEKAEDNYNKAIDFFSNKDSIYKADAIFFRGQVRFYHGAKYLKAIEDFQLSAKYYENLGDKEYAFHALGIIINIYGINGFDKKAIAERKKLIQKKIDFNFIDDLFTEYYNQSLGYKKLDSLAQQEVNLLKAYHLINKSKLQNIKSNKLVIKSSLIKFYALKNDLKKAEKYLQEAEIESKDVDPTSLDYCMFLRAKAQYFILLKEYNKALKFAEISLFYSTKVNHIEGIMESNELLSDIYTAIGNSKKALNFHKKYTKIKDSIYTITKLNALSYYQTLYETERNEKEINSQKNAIDLLAKENQAKKRLILFGGIGLFLLFTTIVLYRNRIRLRRAKLKQEEYSQKLLLSQEEDRKRISKDLHDSLGQSLLLIKNKISLESDYQTKELVNNAIEEMRSISRVLHPFQLEDIGISRALENLIQQLDENYRELYIFGDIDNIQSVLNPNQEVNVFRIVQECLSNIIKHAKADSAKVILVKKEESIVISIKDNGVGFDFSEKYNDFKSLGLKTIKERVKFLKGTLKIDSIKNEGTTFTIQFPTI